MVKDILVHLDGGERDRIRVAAALNMAGRFGGRVTGLFARTETLRTATVARRSSDAFEIAAKHSEQDFTAAAQAAGIAHRWWRLAHGEIGHVLHETVVCARFHDLTILGQHHDGKEAPEELIEHVILQSGRPVLVMPSVGDYPSVGTNVLVAWNGGRESSRALHDAMPIVEKATMVDILTIRAEDGGHPGGDVPLPPVSIHAHLEAHGVSVSRDVLAGEDIGIMDLLLSRAFDQGADLLVMGAHGGYHLPFFKGAGTRHILKHMTLPVLLSH